MSKIVVDLDHTLLPFPIAETVKDLYGIDVSYSDMVEWTWYKKYDLSPNAFYKAVNLAHERQWEEKIPPYHQAVSALHRWRKREKIIIASHKLPKYSEITVKWLNAFDVPFDGLYCSRGGKECLLSPGDLLIDDAPATMYKAERLGVWVAHLEYPWNEEARGRYIHAREWSILAERIELGYFFQKNRTLERGVINDGS